METPTQNKLDQLAKLLQQRLDIIADTRLAKQDPVLHLEQLKNTSKSVFDLQQELVNQIPVRLQHFLEQSSYNKALAFIRGM
ncbi:MAG: hypothetical protein L3J39_07835 [Verrucomicrobiales bacterium]|nr:hypothetical protein [Verrucomicrobiales bacterium]